VPKGKESKITACLLEELGLNIKKSKKRKVVPIVLDEKNMNENV
jgi:hypothetical protein